MNPKAKRNYLELTQELADLEVFDPAAFVGTSEWPQEVCDLVLSLAVAYNDVKDLVFAQQLLPLVWPGEGKPTAARGQYSGIHLHLTKLLAGVINELAELMEKNASARNSGAFLRVIRLLPSEAREAWQAVEAAVAAVGPRSDRFGKLVYYARMKVAFHYDRKEIAHGYRLAFTNPAAGPPYVSRGRNMASTGFYFADAAVDAYMRNAADAETAAEFFAAGWEVLKEINHALREIVLRYVNARGYGWRNPPAA
ncbi:MAG TPA: hypothetical protein VIW45_21720 [Vicinamibacterales bacterium]|jgi:hypothetical protein